MTISFRAARNFGLAILLIIIITVSLFSYVTMSRSSQRLVEIITVDEVKLRGLYDIAEIIDAAKDRLYEYRDGKSEVIAPVDLLINRAIKEVDSLKVLAADAEELASMDEIISASGKLKQAIYAYEVEVRAGDRGSSSAKEMEEIAIKTATHIAQLSREAAVYVGKRIENKNKDIIKISNFSRRMLGFVLLLATFTTVVVALFLARALAKPIQQLVNATQKLAEGELDYRVAIKTEDEIGQLARSFNKMAAELKKSRNELILAKAYTENIIMSMMNALIVIDNEALITTFNKGTSDLLGYAEQQLIGMPVSMIFAKGYFKEIGLDNLINRGFANVETAFQAKNGRHIRVLLSGTIMHDNQGNHAGTVCVAQDITPQKEAMRSAHLASLGEMAAGVAHEINNPINSIINFAQIMIDETESGEKPRLDIPRQIIKEGDRVAGIVKGLLSFARADGQTKSLVNIQDILNEALTLTEAQIHKDGITLKIDLPENLPKILGHFQQVQQVFLNIINNARYALNKKFPGTDQGKIFHISAEEIVLEQQPSIKIVFHDYGTGIPENIREKVLNPFFSTKPADRGTGLGLTISHGIITDHSGKLLIDSFEGEFTKITIILPVVVATAESD